MLIKRKKSFLYSFMTIGTFLTIGGYGDIKQIKSKENNSFDNIIHFYP